MVLTELSNDFAVHGRPPTVPRRRGLVPEGAGASQIEPAASEECYSFASFRLYPRQRTLLRGTELVAIGGRAFDMLLKLVSNAGVIINLSDLKNFVWPNIIVEEANLRVQMASLRKILSQCKGAQRAIGTVPMRGYCFLLPVRHSLKRTELESHAPTLRARLPEPFHPIIGREDAINVITGALNERRLITITGAGGIGKTTVAVVTAKHYKTRFQGEIIFVDLSHVTHGTSAMQLVAQALGAEPQDDALEVICKQLCAREVLLILDTCEHIVAPIAALVEVLLSRCANLRLLVTSREALRVIGEWTHRLPSLTYPGQGEEIDETNMATFSAVTLFLERVRLFMRFEVQQRDYVILAEICRRLDGIPLALELAAARIPDLGLYRIAACLDDLFTILTRGRRTALPRHRTLSAALDWGYGLLSTDEQRMLRHLAALGGSFTVERAILGGGGAGCERPEEVLSDLYEKSLLTVDMMNDTPMYRLLDTTRAYVANRNTN